MRLMAIYIATAVLSLASGVGFGEDPDGNHSAATRDANNAMILGRMERSAPVKKIDECNEGVIESNAAPPNWDSPAVTTQCGVLELDSLFTAQALSGGVRQETMGTVAKFGLTPRLEVRWALPGHTMQSADGEQLVGTTDQWIGACYRFHEQGEQVPDLAIDYAMKIPTANPAKNLGNGYTDHVGTFIASADGRSAHFDFNAAGTASGSGRGFDGAAQFGLAVTRHLLPKLLGTLEAFGGSQPGTSNRYGAVLAGGAWGFRSWLAVNGGYVRAYTASSPRQQFLVGLIYTTRPVLVGSRRETIGGIARR